MKFVKVLLMAGGVFLALSSLATADKLHVKAGGGTLSPEVGRLATEIALDGWTSRVDRYGNIYIAEDDYINNLPGRGFVRINAFGVVDKVFVAQGFSYIDDISVDSDGNVFFLEAGLNNGIYKVTPSGVLTTIANTLNDPAALSVDFNGNLYVGVYGNYIYKIDRSGNMAEFYFNPNDRAETIFADSLGNVYFYTGSQSPYIKKKDKSGSVSIVAGTGIYGYSGDGDLATQAQIGYVTGISADIWGNIYLIDSNRLRKIDYNGVISTIFSQEIPQWSRLSLDNDGMPYITSFGNNNDKILKLQFTPNVTSLSTSQAQVGDRVVVNGRYFGSKGMDRLDDGTPTYGTVTFNGTSAPILFWSNETIICTVPTGATTGNLVVTTPAPDSQQSNAINFKIR